MSSRLFLGVAGWNERNFDGSERDVLFAGFDRFLDENDIWLEVFIVV